ncbi:endonuclease III [Candidatus Pacearchaeota archaeon]|nr:endonuclease III [Candidatus Pacearchaeota archaeon]
MNSKQKFLHIFKLAQKKYSKSKKRLAGEGWKHDWQTLITTIYSAQSRDETTIPVMTNAFRSLPTLSSWSKAPLSKIKSLTKKINYYKTKSKNSKATAQMLIKNFNGKVPNTIEDLVTLPGVGRKTANLILTEIHKKPGITVDTHVHRISNILGLVRTKTPHETELTLQKLVPKKYWSKINRIFVLWGKDVPGRDKKRFLAKLKD